MTELTAAYHDGRTTRVRPVTLQFTDDHRLVGRGDGVTFEFSAAEVSVEARLANAPRFIRMPGDQRCEVGDNDALDSILNTWGPRRTSRLIHRLETSWRLVLVAVVVFGGAAWGLIRYGLPVAARHVAFALPATMTNQLGRDALATLDKIAFQPSKLDAARQAELQARFAEFLETLGEPGAYRIVFRSSKQFGANAFALPSGEIVITDGLVELAVDDREIVGVLAHECGHVARRHILRSVLQNSAVVVVFSMISGDVSGATAVGGALPLFLMQSKFSREFESEADADAVLRLKRAGIDPKFLADMLERLAKTHGLGDGKILNYVSSHPPTPERIRAIQGEK